MEEDKRQEEWCCYNLASNNVAKLYIAEYISEVFQRLDTIQVSLLEFFRTE
jgi:hypothetical protein